MEKNKRFTFFALVLCVISGLPAFTQATGLLSLDDAMASAAITVEMEVEEGTKIVVYGIDSPLFSLSNFLRDELLGHFNNTGTQVVLVHGSAFENINLGQDFQMLGVTNDELAVGLGEYRDAQVVITGNFEVLGSFCQLSIRAIDLSTAEEVAKEIANYSAYIDSNDALLAGAIQLLKTEQLSDVQERAIIYFNRGREWYVDQQYPNVINSLDRAVAVTSNFSDALFYRANSYFLNGEYDKALAEYTAVLKISPYNAAALNNRAVTYANKNNFEKAKADFDAAIKIDPVNIIALHNSIIMLNQSQPQPKLQSPKPVAPAKAIVTPPKKNTATSDLLPQWYTVKRGDTLTKIAVSLYKDYRSWRRIYEVNKSSFKNPNNPSLIYVGMRLRIIPEWYTVKKGDTLTKIAVSMYDDPRGWKRIYEANKSKFPESENPELINPGMQLYIPATK